MSNISSSADLKGKQYTHVGLVILIIYTVFLWSQFDYIFKLKFYVFVKRFVNC